LREEIKSYDWKKDKLSILITQNHSIYRSKENHFDISGYKHRLNEGEQPKTHVLNMFLCNFPLINIVKICV